MLCIDTNVIVFALSGRHNKITERLEREIFRTSVVVPAIVVFELRYGIAASTKRKDNQRRLNDFLDLPLVVLDFTADDAEVAGEIRARLKRAGTPIGPYDVLIAAQAFRRAATLVTANTREFSRVPGLALEDWTA